MKTHSIGPSCLGTLSLILVLIGFNFAAHGVTSRRQPLGDLLDSWNFDDTNWVSFRGHAPMSVSNAQCVLSWDANALQLDMTNAAWLQYPVVNADGKTNLACDYGTVLFWVNPDWDSANVGGSGPGNWARLIEVGQWTTNASFGWWSLCLNPDGTKLYFSAQNNGTQADFLAADMSWYAGTWHQVVLTYSPTNSILYLDGWIATNGVGVSVLPGANALTNGFRIGSDANGFNQAQGQFENLRNYNFPWPWWLVTEDYMLESFYAETWRPPSSRRGRNSMSAPSFSGANSNSSEEPGPYGNSSPEADFGTNLFLEIPSNSMAVPGQLPVNLRNSKTGMPYDLLSRTALNSGTWFIEQYLVGVSNLTATTVPMNGRTNLFLWAVEATDNDGNGFPDWWENYFFGHTGIDLFGNPMADGYSNLDKFRLGLNPNAFETPPAPMPFTAYMNGGGTSATLTWNAPPGPVQQYVIERADPTGLYSGLGSFHPVATVTAPANTYQDTQSPFEQDPESDIGDFNPSFVANNSVYHIQAIYPGGSSQKAIAILMGGDAPFSLDAKLIRNSSGRWELICPFIPPRVAKVRLNWFAWDDFWYFGYFLNKEDVSVTNFTGGIYVIPDTEIITRVAVNDPQFGVQYGEVQQLWVQGVEASGKVGEAMDAGVVAQDAPCFVDGREHLKQNLMFQFRARTLTNLSGIYGSVWDSPFIGGYQLPVSTNFVESSIFHYGIGYNAYGGSTSYVTRNNLWPFSLNYQLHNRLYDPSNSVPSNFEWQTNFDTIPLPAVLAFTNSYSYWISQDVRFPWFYYQPWNTPGTELVNVAANVSGTNLVLQSGAHNLFGLNFLTAVVDQGGYITDPLTGLPSGLIPFTTLAPGGSVATNIVNVFYSQTPAPGLQAAGYYFALVLGSGTDPYGDPIQNIVPVENQPSLPVNPGFSPTNQTPLMIASVGESAVIGGWQKFQLTNGYANKYAFLGQYFTNAYSIDATGNVSATNAGILSPYGEFLPTRPGPAALITMPDIDPPYQRGTGVVQVISLNADGNHDGTLNFNYFSTDQTTPNHPFRFWINDNTDSGEDGGTGIPGQVGNPDGLNWLPGNQSDYRGAFTYRINGTRDLVDFFPVCLNIGNLVKALPPGQHLAYILKQGDSAVNFVYTDLRATNCESYLTDTNVANLIGNGTNRAIAVTSEGTVLDASFLQKIATNGHGIILVEGRANTSKPLVLEVWQGTGFDLSRPGFWNGTNMLAQTKLYLSLTGVEQMFRHKNLMPNISSTNLGAMSDRLTDLSVTNEPDTNDKNFVFLHGYNVNPNQARGWFSDIFKRMYWSGSHAKFYGVTYFGSDGQRYGMVTPNLQTNIVHAFEVAPQLTNFLAKLTNQTVVAAHSLGNMVVLSALSDYQVASIDKYFMFDAAVPMEAMQGNQGQTGPMLAGMIHSEWTSYANKLYANDWSHLFPTNDYRSTLTWSNRLANFQNADVYNFYSSGEEVLRSTVSDPPTNLLSAAEMIVTGYLFNHSPLSSFTWVWQEKSKGRCASDTLLGSTHGGWKFNSSYDTNGVHLGVSQASLLSNSQLSTNAFFDFYSTNFPGDTALLGSGGSAYAQAHRNRILSDAIPSHTLPVGANAVTILDEPSDPHNFDMQSLYENNWPQSRLQGAEGNNWHHSDVREVAYPYTHGLFDKIVNLGNLK